MQKEASRSRGANPPLPLPVNTEKKHKTRTGPFSDLQFQPGVVHRSVPQHLTPAHAYIYYKSRHRSAIITCAQTPVRQTCLATFVRTPRSAHGTGAVRYGTARVESSPVSTRAAFNIPSIGIDPVPHAVS